MSSETGVYIRLREYLDRLPIGYPATESGEEMRVLRHLFTPEEAELALNLSMTPEPLGRIHRRLKKTGISRSDLEKVLDRMVSKGSIMGGEKRGEKTYSMVPLAVGMFEFQVDRLTRGFVEDMWQYLGGPFGEELHRTRTPQLRAIPIEKSLPLPRDYPISTHDSIRELVDDLDGPFAVTNCICKQGKDILGDSCRYTDLREVCLLFKGMAEYMLGLGIGRTITKREVFDILQKAAEAGLVLQPQNTQRPEFVCCCCGDCCGILVSAKKLPRPAELFANNFYAVVNPDMCNGCSDCLERCQMEAITVPGDVARVDLDRCIGCGNCTVVCAAGAVELRKKDREMRPPKSMDALYQTILAERTGRWHMLKTGVKMLLGMKV